MKKIRKNSHAEIVDNFVENPMNVGYKSKKNEKFPVFGNPFGKWRKNQKVKIGVKQIKSEGGKSHVYCR